MPLIAANLGQIEIRNYAEAQTQVSYWHPTDTAAAVATLGYFNEEWRRFKPGSTVRYEVKATANAVPTYVGEALVRQVTPGSATTLGTVDLSDFTALAVTNAG